MITIEYLDELEDVYDITVEENHNFFADDILVHNCAEIVLHSSEEHTYTCVLSSMNVSKYDEWKNTDAVYWATIFLDCVAEEFLQKAREVRGLEKAVRFTEKGRALGLGQCGFHTYLQKNMIPFESLEAHMKNTEIAKHIYENAMKATKDMAVLLGEPEWCKGLGIRNTHLIAVAPTKSCVAPDTRFVLSDGSTMSYRELMKNNNLEV